MAAAVVGREEENAHRFLKPWRYNSTPEHYRLYLLLSNCAEPQSGQEAPLTEHEPELFWDSTYAIVVALMEHHPQRRPETVGLEELTALVESLPGFQDDPALLNERLLLDILTVWYEEAT